MRHSGAGGGEPGGPHLPLTLILHPSLSGSWQNSFLFLGVTLHGPCLPAVPPLPSSWAQVWYLLCPDLPLPVEVKCLVRPEPEAPEFAASFGGTPFCASRVLRVIRSRGDTWRGTFVCSACQGRGTEWRFGALRWSCGEAGSETLMGLGETVLPLERPDVFIFNHLAP